MIKCCIFDMGGVIFRNFHVWPELTSFLGINKKLSEIDPRLHAAMNQHGQGKISESDFWSLYTQISGNSLPPCETETLLGKFFHPTMDEATVRIVEELKAAGNRVVIGTNTIDAHYKIHTQLKQYAIFDKVYASHLMGISKPDPAFYSTILEAEGISDAFGIRAEDAFFTDDMAVNVEAAAAMGIKAFLYSDASALREQLLSLGFILSSS